jgi:DNA-binding GntR family transcriptional regulator
MPPETRPLTREERHHLEIVTLALQGEIARASALAREHLSDHPEDAVVARLLADWEGQ